MTDADDVSQPAEISAPTVRRPVFAIFEGGGAKGVAHVGALQALADNGLDLIGVAGASAGALAAVLAAIGLEASDIMDAEDPGKNILADYGLSPIQLLGEEGWSQYLALRALRKDVLGGGILEGFFEAAYALPGVSYTLHHGWKRHGHLRTDRVREFVNQVIRDRLLRIKAEADLPFEVPDEVTFSDLSDAWPTVIPLKIVVTDVTEGTLEVLDRKRTPQAKIAEAVAASIAIPFVFEPAAIPSFRPGVFADGGLVSNLPLWVFAEEKLAHERENYSAPPAPIIGFSLRALDAGDGGMNSIWRYARKLAETALAGSQSTSRQFLEDVTVVTLRTSLGLLDFDARPEVLARGREEGRVCADRELSFSLRVKPDRIRHELGAIRDEALAVLNAGRDQPVAHLRANLIRPAGFHSLRVVEGVNMQGDADDRLLLDRRGRGAAEAYRDRGLRIFSLLAAADPAAEFMTKYERALLRPSVEAVICVPIFEEKWAWDKDEGDRPEPKGVLSLDSDEDLAAAFNNPNLINMLVDKSGVLFEAIRLEPTDG